MPTGALTSHMDVAQVVLYAFWFFFFGLVVYLRREDRREGYPLEADPSGRIGNRMSIAFPIPPAKTFALPHGGTASAPNDRRDTRDVAARRVAPWPGAPLQPIGDPMLAAVGPGAFAERADVPDLTIDGAPKIVPLRVATPFSIASEDSDPRGMTVHGADGRVAGTVTDAWVDQSEALIRYLEVGLDGAGGARRVLLPMTLARIDGRRRRIAVRSILASQFANVPAHKTPDQVTLREEDRICAYYGGGQLYAFPARTEPLL